MKNKIGITADCSSGLEYAPFEHKVKITRTTINFLDKVLVDGVDVTADQFYELLKKTDEVPSTSAPTPGEIMRRVEEWQEEGATDVIHFAISFGLSAYGENLQATGNDLVEGMRVHVFNSGFACLMEGYQAYYAQQLAEKGYSVEEIFAECEKLKKQTSVYLAVDDLKYLVKNGRLKPLSGTIGSILRIKPIVTFTEEGKLEVFEKVRTASKATQTILEHGIESGKKYKDALYLVLHTSRHEDANQLAKTLADSVSNTSHNVDVTTVTPTVGAHIGCGVIAIAVIGLDGLKEKLV